MTEQINLVKHKKPAEYTYLTSLNDGEVFSRITLPDGTVIKRVSQAVHERALKRVAERYKGGLGAKKT